MKKATDNEELYYHKRGDKIKWIVTSVAFLLVFALLIGLCVVVFRPKEKTDQLEQTGEMLTNLLAFDNAEQRRTVYSADKQVWEDNGITFTNLKGNGSDIGDFSDPVLLYAHSTVKLESVNMTKVVFYCAGSADAHILRNSVKTVNGVSVEVSGSEVTVAFDPTAKTFEIEDLDGQVQLEQVAVTVIIPPVEAKTANAVDGEGHAMQAGKTYPMPTAMAFTSDRLAAAIASGSSVDVKVSVTVYPVDAANKTVDFSVGWGVAPTNGKNTVTDYVTVTPDSDGSTTATVSCKKAFGSDQIIITVTTRDGGYTATCTVTFIGKASNMSITSSTLTPKSNLGRGSFFELGTGQTYNFSINLSNIFGNVGSKNLSVKLGGAGSLYFGKYHRVAQGTVYEDIHQIEMSELVEEFITSATISGTTLSLTAGSTIMTNYFSSMDSSYRYDRYVASGSPFSTDNYDKAVSHNEANIENCYFTVTVTDNVSGLERTIKLWVVSAVSSVQFSQKTLTF